MPPPKKKPAPSGTPTAPSGNSFNDWDSIFIPTGQSRNMDRNKSYNKPLLQYMPHLQSKEQDGEIGLEIECEGMNLFSAPISWWGTHVDHSLRAYKDHQPIEYVLRKPVSRTDVPKALTYLSRKLKEVGSNVVDSHRTSVHVHVNCQKLTFKEVIQYWAVYAIFEELLVEFSGSDRRGNLFCLRAKDAEHFIQLLEAGLQQNDYTSIFDKDVRYTACNMASLYKFGSIEFRSMRGTVDQELIQLWVDILLLLRDKALEYKDPQDIVKDFEKYGPEFFLKKITSSRLDIYNLLKSFPDYTRKMWDGLRLMRDVAYAISWEERIQYKEKEKEKVQSSISDDIGHNYPKGIGSNIWIIPRQGKFWIVNYNSAFVTAIFMGHSFGIKGRSGIWVDTVLGKHMGEKFLLSKYDYPPGHNLYVPFSNESSDETEEDEETEEEFVEPDYETEMMNEAENEF